MTSKGDDFWTGAFSPVREETHHDNEKDDDDLAEFKAFQAETKPEQKTRQQLLNAGIDRTPMMPVSEIRAMFNKGKVPVFPKQVFTGGSAAAPAASRKIGGTGAGGKKASDETVMHPQKSQEYISLDSDTGSTAGAAEATPVEQPAAVVEATPAAPAAPAVVEEKPAAAAAVANPSLLSDEEFMKIAKFQGCEEAIKYYTSARPVEIVIQPDDGGQLLIKEMGLQYNHQHRLLVMVRKTATRYIRLNDLKKLDGQDSSLSLLTSKSAKKATAKLKGQKPVALFFTTTENPMIIMLGNNSERDLLIKLIIFLRELLQTKQALEIYV